MAIRCDFAMAAEGLTGTRFRLHGRDMLTGLDCVGVVIAALAAIGRQVHNPLGYRLRNLDHQRFLHLFGEAGFVRCGGSVEMGDVVQLTPGPGQMHLLVAATNGDFIHAHAQLGRVVRSPSPLPWPIDALWRLNAN